MAKSFANRRSCVALLVLAGLIAGCGRDSETQPEALPQHVGGTISGLGGILPITLLLNGVQPLPIAQDGTFQFGRALPAGTSYEVSLYEVPPGLRCQIDSGEGVIGRQAVEKIVVQCQCRQEGVCVTLLHDRQVRASTYSIALYAPEEAEVPTHRYDFDFPVGVTTVVRAIDAPNGTWRLIATVAPQNTSGTNRAGWIGCATCDSEIIGPDTLITIDRAEPQAFDIRMYDLLGRHQLQFP